MSRDAMKLALEAAEVLEKLFKQAEAMNEDMAAGVNVHCQITVADLSKGLYAAPVIREALAEQSAKEKAPQSANCEAPGWINSDHARRDDCTTEQPAQHRAWFTVDELNAWADKKLKENPQWEEQPAQVDPCIDGSCSCCWAQLDEQPAQQTDSYVQQVPDKCDRIVWRGSYYHLPLQPAQQEPVAVAMEAMSEDPYADGWTDAMNAMKRITPQPAQQGQVAWTLLLTGEHHGLVGKAGEKFVGAPDYYERVDVYTSPPAQRKPLTDEQIDAIAAQFSTWMFAPETGRRDCERAIARAIEAALGIKENT